ncbi:MAG TPA: hypothetical protein VF526_02145 [Solirubrobacteraceae bacterium]|jgi:hypothetical protein
MGFEDVLDLHAHVASHFEVDIYVKARIDDRGHPGPIVSDENTMRNRDRLR